MRIHRLEVTAFGPFAERCVVDFDELTEGGLFLVHGPTGAGKTSLLDAVCYALYAAVPGARGARASLRSHHAPADAVPLVVLELTAAGRRLRIARQPSYSKASRAHPVPAKVALEERRGGRWVQLSARHDEVGDVVNDVMGMGRQQFERVVLLPQGDFAAFLRSTAEDRRKVLDKLFDVSTYGDVEAWLAERRRELAADVALGRAELSRLGSELTDLLARVPDVRPDDGDDLSPLVRDGEGPPPLLGDGDDLSPLVDVGADPERLAAALITVAERLGASVTQTLAAHEMAETAAATAAEHWTVSERTEVVRAKGRQAQTVLEALVARETELEPLRAKADAASSAAPLRGHLAAILRAADEESNARAMLAGAETAAAGLGMDLAPGSAETADLGADLPPGSGTTAHLALASVLASDGAVSRAVRHREDWQRHATRLGHLSSTARAARADVERLTGSLAAADEALVVLVNHHDIAAQRSALLPGAAAEVAEAERRLALRAAWEAASADLALARTSLHVIVNAEQDARDSLLGLRERRIDGMAGELAESLADEAPCPVCGSEEHPRPADRALPVSAQDIERAESVHALAASAREVAANHLAGLEGAQSIREGQLDGQTQTATDLRATLEDARSRRSEARAQGEQAAALAAEVATTQLALDAGRTALAAAAERAAAAESAGRTVAEQAAEARAGLIDAVADHASTCPCADRRDGPPVQPAGGEGDQSAQPTAGEDDQATAGEDVQAVQPTAGEDDQAVLVVAVEALARRHDDARLLLQAVAGARRSLERRQVDARAAGQALDAAMIAAGFDDAAAVEQALLPPDDLADLVTRLRRHDDDRLRLESVLADPEVAAALTSPACDLLALDRRRQASREVAREALRRHTQAQDAFSTGRRIIDDLTAAAARLGPLADRSGVLTEVAEAAAGGGSNSLRMPLSSFVLAARLERVAELANERLSVMGEGRFELRHTDDRTGNAKSGLGLEVVDLWTGQSRSTSTLSGGESFMASLALALGLADAVREEAGGIDLQTLFIDEGFGTLDDESLEQVMAVLDTLRDGGRAVGVVSHVADLRTRIPRQVKVTKTPHGSSVTLVGTETSDVA